MTLSLRLVTNKLMFLFLAQAERLLKTNEKDGTESVNERMQAIPSEIDSVFADSELDSSFAVPAEFILGSTEIEVQAVQTSSPFQMFPQSTQESQAGAFPIEDFSWAMIELGVHEPLPPQDTIDELYEPFFLYFHISLTVPEHKSTLQKSTPQSP